MLSVMRRSVERAGLKRRLRLGPGRCSSVELEAIAQKHQAEESAFRFFEKSVPRSARIGGFVAEAGQAVGL